MGAVRDLATGDSRGLRKIVLLRSSCSIGATSCQRVFVLCVGMGTPDHEEHYRSKAPATIALMAGTIAAIQRTTQQFGKNPQKECALADCDLVLIRPSILTEFRPSPLRFC